MGSGFAPRLCYHTGAGLQASRTITAAKKPSMECKSGRVRKYPRGSNKGDRSGNSRVSSSRHPPEPASAHVAGYEQPHAQRTRKLRRLDSRRGTEVERALARPRSHELRDQLRGLVLDRDAAVTRKLARSRIS